PGIPGIGPKTASTLIKKYSSVENIVQHAHELKGKQKELVEAYGDQAILSKKLATIITDVPVDFSLDKLAYSGPDADILKPIFDELEFKTISARVFGSGSPSVSSQTSQLSMFDSAAEPSAAEENGERKNFGTEVLVYHLADTPSLRNDLIKKLSGQKSFAFEVVSTAAPESEAVIQGLSFSFSPGEAYYVPTPDQKETAAVLKALHDILTNEKIIKVGHNLKASILALKINGGDVAGPMFDSMLAHYLIEPEASHDLPIICAQYLSYDLLKDGDQKISDQSCERVDHIMQLKDKLEVELQKRQHIKLMNDVEMPLVGVLASMEFEGVKIDEAALAKMSDELREESERVQEDIFKIAGTQFNIASPKQLGEILFEQMKLIDKPKKTKSGQYSTSEDVLQSLSAEHEIAKKILDFREYEKLRSTYVDALPKMISKRDGRIHTDYRQAWAVTGRLSSNNPNLQNIPIRTEKGRAIRKAFVARDNDHLFMSADYSQIELRIAASFAQDKTMID